MYVRNQSTGRRVRPPENYSGNAFDSNGYRTSPDLPIPQSLLPAAEDTPPAMEEAGMPLPELDGQEEVYTHDFGTSDRAPEPTEDADKHIKSDSDHRQHDDGIGGLKGLLASIMPPRPEGEKSDFGFEDMLIIGLIFLLSQSEGDEDILLVLTLLLFYK